MAAVVADGISLSVGADPARVGWAVEHAVKARANAGLDPDGLRLAAFINVAVHDNLETAARITSGKLASFSRFSVMHGAVTGGATAEDRSVLEALHNEYDMTEHGRADADHAASIPLDFTERNAVIGSADRCLERLWELRKLGITRFFFTEDFSRDGVSGEAHQNLVEHVLPEMKTWT
jgi:5,10-methylenetetrahydromethanopterin reductase